MLQRGARLFGLVFLGIAASLTGLAQAPPSDTVAASAPSYGSAAPALRSPSPPQAGNPLQAPPLA